MCSMWESPWFLVDLLRLVLEYLRDLPTFIGVSQRFRKALRLSGAYTNMKLVLGMIKFEK